VAVNDTRAPGAAREPTPAGTSLQDRLTRATALLRQHTDAGWKTIEDDVVARTLSLFRPSAPVRGHHDLGEFFVAADLVVTRLRRSIDEVPNAAAEQIACATSADDDHLEQVTIQLVVAFGAPLLEVAGQVHAVAVDVLRDLLGAFAPVAERVRTHVHVGDVTDDPRLVR